MKGGKPMASYATLREKIFRVKKRKHKCFAKKCLESFERDQLNVKMPPNGKVSLNWDPGLRRVEYVIYSGKTRSVVREFYGVSSEMMVDFIRKLRGRYPELQITNTIIL